MKILFLCGCLEPGCDGVGDYTRMLSAEVIRQGHDAFIISFNDHFIQDTGSGCQFTTGISIPVYRISSNHPEKDRIALAHSIVQSFDPDWISIQFVPFSFHRKGLSFHLGKRLKQIAGVRNVHIMFHELWVGKENIKNLILSSLQQLLVTNFIHTLKPHVIHTHLPVYRIKLNTIGVSANSLTLFSNIPVYNTAIPKDDHKFSIGFFSQVSASPDIIKFMSRINDQVGRSGKELEVIMIGGNKITMHSAGDFIEQSLQLKNKVVYTGKVPPEVISCHIQRCNLGVTPLPLHALGKSGTVATFLAHGIPVAVPSWQNKNSKNDLPFFSSAMQSSLLLEPEIGHMHRLACAACKSRSELDLKTITKKFLSDLNPIKGE